MNVTPDTNVLLRILVEDDLAQTAAALRMLEQAAKLAITLPALCEMVWVLGQGYKLGRAEIANAIRQLMDMDSAEMNRPAVEAGLRLLEAGGDFADGVIAHEGSWLGGEIFCSFDKRAVKLLVAAGEKAELLA